MLTDAFDHTYLTCALKWNPTGRRRTGSTRRPPPTATSRTSSTPCSARCVLPLYILSFVMVVVPSFLDLILIRLHQPPSQQRQHQHQQAHPPFKKAWAQAVAFSTERAKKYDHPLDFLALLTGEGKLDRTFHVLLSGLVLLSWFVCECGWPNLTTYIHNPNRPLNSPHDQAALAGAPALRAAAVGRRQRRQRGQQGRRGRRWCRGGGGDGDGAFYFFFQLYPLSPPTLLIHAASYGFPSTKSNENTRSGTSTTRRGRRTTSSTSSAWRSAATCGTRLHPFLSLPFLFPPVLRLTTTSTAYTIY